ncbi:hypothetical protein H0H81_007901 [Sphagnurus paluster]|uniref:Dicer dsRNA-binding fold domain-containing protein n=1 Tax=Sphagnurus paluster TaxID=117069 RepID=A0A9P7FVQ9_9AGAR|nr:hypothetical protein H0H81_007901 [Sphagnurus paluster]
MGPELLFEKPFQESKEVLKELGTCASNLVWKRALKELDSLVVENDTCSVQTRMRDCIKNWTFVMPNLDPSSQAFNVSHKFSVLVKALESCEPYGEAFRGIIFVRNETVALAMADLLRKLDDQLGFVRPIALAENYAASGAQAPVITQALATRTYNLVITSKLETSMAMEIKFSTIICFDDATRFDDILSLMRRHEVHLIYLVGRNQFQRKSDLPQQSALNIVEHFTVDEASDAEHAFIEDPTTGSRIYRHTSVDAMERIASSRLRSNEFLRLNEQHKGPGSASTFMYSVIIPGLCDITGPPRLSKDDAKRAACYRACQNLASIGLIDCRVFPPSTKLADNFGHAFDRTSLDSKPSGTKRYLKKEPDFWTNTRDVPIISLFPVIISTNHTDEDGKPYAPLAILTRQPLPDLQNFRLFYSGVPSVVSIKRGAPLRIEAAQVQDLHLYTLRICRLISNKYYDATLANTVYFIAPLALTWKPSNDDVFNNPLGLPCISEYIPWDLVSLAARSYSIPLKKAVTLEETESDIHDAAIQDRAVEFSKRYVAVRMRPDLSPLSKLSDSPREAEYENLLALHKARRVEFEGLQDEHQPLIEVSPLPSVLNQLNPASRPSPEKLGVKCGRF